MSAVPAMLVLGEIDGWPKPGTEIMVERAETRGGGAGRRAARWARPQ